MIRKDKVKFIYTSLALLITVVSINFPAYAGNNQEQKTMSNTIHDLPREIMQNHIFTEAGLPSLNQIELVSREWKANVDTIGPILLKKQFSSRVLNMARKYLAKKSNVSEYQVYWKDIYKLVSDHKAIDDAEGNLIKIFALAEQEKVLECEFGLGSKAEDIRKALKTKRIIFNPTTDGVVERICNYSIKDLTAFKIKEVLGSPQKEETRSRGFRGEAYRYEYDFRGCTLEFWLDAPGSNYYSIIKK